MIEWFNLLILLILLLFLRIIVSSSNIIDSPPFLTFIDNIWLNHSLLLFLYCFTTALTFAADYIIRMITSMIYLSLRMPNWFALFLLKVILRISPPVDNIELIIGGILIKPFSIFKPHAFWFIFFGYGNRRVASYDIIISIVLVVILLNIDIHTRCCIWSFIFWIC